MSNQTATRRLIQCFLHTVRPCIRRPKRRHFEELIEQRCQSFLRLNIRREGAAKNIKESQKSQKKYHDKKIKRTDIKVGDNVLVHNARKTTRKGGKLSKNWNGPYVVENVLGKGTYRLSD